MGTPSRWVSLPSRVAWPSPHPALSLDPAAGAGAGAGAGAAARRDGVGASAGAPLSPAARARHLGGEAQVSQAWYPGNPEGRRGREEISFSGVVQPRSREPDISARVPRAARPPAPTPPPPNQKRKEPRPRSGVGGEVRALPVRRGRHFVTSPASQQARATRAPPTPARRSAARSRLRSPRVPSLRPGLPPRRGVSHRAARGRPHRPQGGRRLDGWHVAPPPPEQPDARPG